MTITFLTYTSYTSQSIAVVTTATFIPVYLFIARRSYDRMSGVKGKGKGFPYSTSSVGPGADPGVQAVRLQVTVSHAPNS